MIKKSDSNQNEQSKEAISIQMFCLSKLMSLLYIKIEKYVKISKDFYKIGLI